MHSVLVRSAEPPRLSGSHFRFGFCDTDITTPHSLHSAALHGMPPQEEKKLARVEKFLEKLGGDEDAKSYHEFSRDQLRVELKSGENVSYEARYLEW